jgi:soluble lytic murein transglycosylase
MKNSKALFITLVCLIVILFSIFLTQKIAFKTRFDDLFDKYSNEYKVDKALLFSIAKAESNFNENAISKVGAIGVMQIMPSTAKYINEVYKLNIYNEDKDLFNPSININLGVLYVNYLFNKFNDYKNVICAYNAGETVVRLWLKDDNLSKNNTLLKIPYKETFNYYEKVSFNYNYYKVNI